MNSFEEKMKMLEDILNKMENENMPLHEIMSAHKQGKELISSLEQELQNAEQQIEIMKEQE